MEDPAGGKICSAAAARRPACRAGEIFLIRRVAGGGRGIQRFKSQQERLCATAARRGGDGRVHLGSRSAGQTAPGGALGLNYGVRKKSRTCPARRPLPERTRTVGIFGPCEPDRGDLPKWTEDRTANCRRERAVGPFRAGSAHTRDDGAQRRQALLHRGPHGGGHILVFMAINNARAGARVSPICSARSPMRRKRASPRRASSRRQSTGSLQPHRRQLGLGRLMGVLGVKVMLQTPWIGFPALAALILLSRYRPRPRHSNLDPEIANGALQLRVPKQQLDGRRLPVFR